MGVEKVKGEVNLDILETGQKRNTRLFFSPLIIQLTTWCQRKDKAIGILTDVLFMLHINAVTQKKSVNYAAKNAWRVCIIVYQNYIFFFCFCGWGGGGGGGGGGGVRWVKGIIAFLDLSLHRKAADFHSYTYCVTYYSRSL